MVTIMKRKAKIRFGRVGVLMGGFSTERAISLKSGEAVVNALKEEGLDVAARDIKTPDASENLRLIRDTGMDIAFIALHGRFGEDGQMQDILEYLGIPYTGSGVLASRLALDKIASRQIFQIHGLAVPRYKIIQRLGFHKNSALENYFGFPLVVKPATHGSSIGLSIIDSAKDLRKALEAAFGFDEHVLIEEYIRGTEITVGILKDKPLPVIEIRPKNRFFDYQAKYKSGMTEYIVPAQIKKETAQKASRCALLAHKFLGCAGFSRVDMILDDGIPYILEVNTIPGLTQTSLLPRAAKVIGLSFNELCIQLLVLAYERQKKSR